MGFIKKHIEWIAFLFGLILMASMDPYSQGVDLCLFDALGLSFCPGDGLGHSIAFLFRGELINSVQANLMGPFAVVVLSIRIFSIWKDLFINRNKDLTEITNG